MPALPQLIFAPHYTCSFDESLAALRRFAEHTHLRIGTSAAANWLAALDVAAKLGEGRIVVTVFPSLATPDEWDKAQVQADPLYEPGGSRLKPS